jgi:hypothetical protein
MISHEPFPDCRPGSAALPITDPDFFQSENDIDRCRGFGRGFNELNRGASEMWPAKLSRHVVSHSMRITS